MDPGFLGLMLGEYKIKILIYLRIFLYIQNVYTTHICAVLPQLLLRGRNVCDKGNIFYS